MMCRMMASSIKAIEQNFISKKKKILPTLETTCHPLAQSRSRTLSGPVRAPPRRTAVTEAVIVSSNRRQSDQSSSTGTWRTKRNYSLLPKSTRPSGSQSSTTARRTTWVAVSLTPGNSIRWEFWSRRSTTLEPLSWIQRPTTSKNTMRSNNLSKKPKKRPWKGRVKKQLFEGRETESCKDIGTDRIYCSCQAINIESYCIESYFQKFIELLVSNQYRKFICFKTST